MQQDDPVLFKPILSPKKWNCKSGEYSFTIMFLGVKLSKPALCFKAW